VALDPFVEQRPIIFLLQNSFAPFNVSMLTGLANSVPIVVVFESSGRGVIRPQELSITRPGKGVVINTADGAFLDDFGEGVATILLGGHTGWDQGGGLAALKTIEQLFIEYHSRRSFMRQNNMDLNAVQLWYIDTLNLEAFSIYPQEFSVTRSREHPLWLFYRMKLIGLADLLETLSVTLFGKTYGPLSLGPSGLLPALISSTASFGALATSFGGLLPF
jgi:hypothetical protein